MSFAARKLRRAAGASGATANLALFIPEAAAGYRQQTFDVTDPSDMNNVLDSVTNSGIQRVLKPWDQNNKIVFGFTPTALYAMDLSDPTDITLNDSAWSAHAYHAIDFDQEIFFHVVGSTYTGYSYGYSDPLNGRGSQIDSLQNIFAFTDCLACEFDSVGRYLICLVSNSYALSVTSVTTGGYMSYEGRYVDTGSEFGIYPRHLCIAPQSELAFIVGENIIANLTVACVDYSTPSAPSLADTITFSASSTASRARIVVDETRTHVFACTSETFAAVDYSTPTALSVSDTLDLSSYDNNFGDVLYDENSQVAYLPSYGGHLVSVDCSDPENLSVIQHLDYSASQLYGWQHAALLSYPAGTF